MMFKWIDRNLYKPNSRDIDWGNIIPSVVLVLVFFVIIIFNNKRLSKLKEERDAFKRFTIGVTKAEHNNIRGSLVIDYEYFFARAKYLQSGSTKNWLIDKPNTHWGHYYVQFAYTNPINAEILFDYPVPDSIVNPPDSGWKYIPESYKVSPK